MENLSPTFGDFQFHSLILGAGWAEWGPFSRGQFLRWPVPTALLGGPGLWAHDLGPCYSCPSCPESQFLMTQRELNPRQVDTTISPQGPTLRGSGLCVHSWRRTSERHWGFLLVHYSKKDLRSQGPGALPSQAGGDPQGRVLLPRAMLSESSERRSPRPSSPPPVASHPSME